MGSWPDGKDTMPDKDMDSLKEWSALPSRKGRWENQELNVYIIKLQVQKLLRREADRSGLRLMWVHS